MARLFSCGLDYVFMEPVISCEGVDFTVYIEIIIKSEYAIKTLSKLLSILMTVRCKISYIWMVGQILVCEFLNYIIEGKCYKFLCNISFIFWMNPAL